MAKERKISRRDFLKAVGVVGGAAVAGGLSACSGQAPPTATPTKAAAVAATAAPKASPTPLAVATPIMPKEIRWGYAPTTSSAPAFVSEAKGYFKDEGLTVKLINMPATTQAIAAVATGELDGHTAGFSAAIFNAVAQGTDIKFVANNSHIIGGELGSLPILIRKDLYDSGVIKSVKDWKGRPVAAGTGKGATVYLILAEILEMQGMTIDDVRAIIHPELPRVVDLLESKQVDVAVTVEPYGMFSEEKAVGKIIGIDKDFIPKGKEYDLAGTYFGGKFIKSYPDAMKALLRAFSRAVDKDQIPAYNKGPNRKEFIKIVNEYTKVPEDIIDRSGWSIMRPSGKLDVKVLDYMQDRWFKFGEIPKKVPVESLVVPGISLGV